MTSDRSDQSDLPQTETDDFMSFSLDSVMSGGNTNHDNTFHSSLGFSDEGKAQRMDETDLNFLSELLQQDDGVPPAQYPVDTLPVSNVGPRSLSNSDGRNAAHSSDDLSGTDEPSVKQKPEIAINSIVQVDDREKKRRSLSAKNARLYRSRKKGKVVDLRACAHGLQQHLNKLRLERGAMRVDSAVTQWEEMAILQRLKRRQAEEINEQLQQALFVYSSHVRNLKSIFAESAPPSAALNMRHYLHAYIHLRRDPQTRARDLEAIGSDAKLDRGMQVVLRETATIQPTLSPEILFQELDMGAEGLGKTSTAVYAFNTRDASKAFQVTCQAIFESNGVWPDYTRVNSLVKLVDTPPTKHNVRYGITMHTYQHKITNNKVSSEARDLYFSRMVGSCGVLVWDYVDADDLYPLKRSTYIKRNTIGALVIRPEICHDGVERIVCRSICTDMQMLVNVGALDLKVAEFALLEDMMLFNAIKEGVTD